MNDPLKVAGSWLLIALVLIALVEVVPASNQWLVWTLGLILLYLVLANVDRFGRLVDSVAGSVRL